MMIIISHEK